MLGGLLAPAAVAFLPYLPLALAVALLPLGTAFTFPCVTAMLSRVIPSKERGLYMGVQQTFGGAARVVFPIVFGVLFDIALPLPFLLSASLGDLHDLDRNGDGGVRAAQGDVGCGLTLKTEVRGNPGAVGWDGYALSRVILLNRITAMSVTDYAPYSNIRL